VRTRKERFLMMLRISFTIMMGLLMLFLLGCGNDDDDIPPNGGYPPPGATTGSITGRVVDENGNPVSGATVTTEPETSQIITAADGSYELANVPSKKYTVRAKKGNQEGTAIVTVAGGAVTADIRLIDLPPQPDGGDNPPPPPPPGEISIEITFPKPNEKAEWRTTITGKLLGDVKDKRDLKAKLNLNPNDELKIRLWVWDPPDRLWPQPDATIKNNLEWVEDEPAWFGREGNIDVGKTFNVKAELVKKQGEEFILIDEVDSVTITDVIRK
jgi:hypothetical protein